MIIVSVVAPFSPCFSLRIIRYVYDIVEFIKEFNYSTLKTQVMITPSSLPCDNIMWVSSKKHRHRTTEFHYVGEKRKQKELNTNYIY